MSMLLAATLGVGEIVLIVACSVFVVSVVVAAIVRKVKGKPACCDECSGNCACCHSTKTDKKSDN